MDPITFEVPNIQVSYNGNGTPWVVKDINSGGHSNPEELTAVGNTLYFEANDGTHGRELWKSDGTTNGTVMVKGNRWNY